MKGARKSSLAAKKKPSKERFKNKRRNVKGDEEKEEEAQLVRPLVQTPRGMEDVLWEDQKYWSVISDTFQQISTSFNMKPISVPIVEEATLFTKSIGEETDIVAKELFYVKDRRGSERLALRPEFTAGIVRAYLEHGMGSWPQPVRLWYFGPVFRHDRPQAGRYRQSSQFGVEVIGEGHPIIDAQVIHLAFEVYKSLQLDAFRIEVNSIGCLSKTCRPAYISLLKRHAREHLRKLCTDCRRRVKANPLRILDCKEEKCRVVANTAPKLPEHICDECREHYKEVLQHLRELSIPFKENPHLVRGLDYYTRTVFEVVSTLPGTENISGLSLGGGGRYDGLVELLGGAPTPAVGFAGGVERTIIQMRAEGIEIKVNDTPEIFLAHLGDLGRRRALKLFDDLRRAGFHVAEAFHKDSIKAQLRVADRLHIPWGLILGQKEALDNAVILRNMESGIQETLDMNLDSLLPTLRKRLRRDVSTDNV